MANPITAIASRSCAKNSLLKQTTGGEKDDLSKGSSTTEVSTAADVQENIGGGRAISGDRTDTTITTPGSEGTGPTMGYSGGGTFKNKEEKDWYDNQIQQRVSSGMSQEDAIQDYRDTFKIGKKNVVIDEGSKGTQGDSDTTSDFEMDQEQVKGQENLDLRADIRQEKILNRLDRQAERRQDRFERKGLSGKDKRDLRKQQRTDRKASNIQRQQNVQNLIADRRALRDLQRDQGSFGGEKYNVGKVEETKEGVVDRVAKQSFTPTQVTETPSGKTKVGSIIEGVGNVFAKKEGGTDVGNALRGIFKTESPAPLKKNYFNK